MTTCHKCPAMKATVRALEGVSVEYIDDTNKDFSKECAKWNAVSAPTAIVFDDDKEVARFTDSVELEAFFELE